MFEAMLQSEMDSHLGYDSNDHSAKKTDDRRNGYTSKKLKTSMGEIEIEAPRDRDGSFEPQVIPKRTKDVSGIEDKVLTMYAKGMSQRDIADTIEEIYGFEISHETISTITDRVISVANDWQNRSLKKFYAFFFVDCLYVTIRKENETKDCAVYVVLGYDIDGVKDILGIWIGESEGKHYWMQIFDEIKSRGVEDILFISMDGVSGLEEGAKSIFKDVVVQRCIVHLIRNSIRYVPSKDYKAYTTHLKKVYGASSLKAAVTEFERFKEAWKQYPGAVAVWERNWNHVEQLFAESTARYNAKQKRNDRKITCSYYESLFHKKPSSSVVTSADKRKSFYEDVVQIGKMEDSGVDTEDAQLVAECLKEYMAGYQQRNPNFIVFNAVLHMDEKTPHLHIDYVPIGHYKRGQDIQNGIAQALKEMGYGGGKDAVARWRASEVEVLNQICLAHGIQPLAPEKSRGSLSVAEYKEARQEADQLANENAQLKQENDSISQELNETKAKLADANKKKVKLMKIDSVEVKPTIFGNKVTLLKDDFDNIKDLAEKEVASIKQTKKLTALNQQLQQENVELQNMVNNQAQELSKYKQPASISMKQLKEQDQSRRELDGLKSKLNKALSFIQEYGLFEAYQRYRTTSKAKDSLE